MPGVLSFFAFIIFVLKIMAYASILLLDLAESLGKKKGLSLKGLNVEL